MLRNSFSHIDTWVFDLDNTLYPSNMRLFDQIEEKMTRFMMREIGVAQGEANALRKQYWAEYGTTLAGLMHRHGVDPEPYLVEVHDISFEPLSPDAGLARTIHELPGRKIVFTNGTAPYAENVLKARGLSGLFDGVFGIEHASYCPKPQRPAFEQVFSQAGVNPERAAMFEDDARNLSVPHQMGLQTVHVAPEQEFADHIHHHTDDLARFLAKIV